MASAEVQGVITLLLADDWLKKSEVAQEYWTHLRFMRDTLEQESHQAKRRGAIRDACIFAAHVSLLNDIQRFGLAVVQAEIVRAMSGHRSSGN